MLGTNKAEVAFRISYKVPKASSFLARVGHDISARVVSPEIVYRDVGKEPQYLTRCPLPVFPFPFSVFRFFPLPLSFVLSDVLADFNGVTGLSKQGKG